MYNHAALKYTLEVIIYPRERKVLVKLTTIYSILDCCIKIPIGFLRVIEESKLHVCFPGYRRPESIYWILLHANIFLDRSLALNFFSASSLRQALSLSLVSLPLTLSFSASFVHSYAQSLSLSLIDFTFTFIIFFWCLLYSKRHFLVRFSSWKS